MMFGNSRNVLAALVLLLCINDVGAVRGTSIRRGDGVTRQNRRRAEKKAWNEFGSLERDDPEAMAAAEGMAAEAKAKATRAKGTKKDAAPQMDSEEMFDEDVDMAAPSEEDSEENLERQEPLPDLPTLPEAKGAAESKAAAKKAGAAKADPDTPTFDSEDVYTESDPELDSELSQSNPDDIPAEQQGLDEGLGVESPASGALERTTSTITREIPLFSLQYVLPPDVPQPTYEHLPDFNELRTETLAFLDVFFSTEFEETPADYVDSSVILHLTGEPLTVDIQVAARFGVPGEVPTLHFMFDKIRAAFEHPEHLNFYLHLLAAMATSNPFQKTIDVNLINHTPDSISGGAPNSLKATTKSTNKNFVIPFLAGMGCLVLIVIGIVWVRRNGGKKEVFDDDSAMLLDDDSTRTGDSNATKDRSAAFYSARAMSAQKALSGQAYSTRPYGADDETLRYLESIRERYSETDDDTDSRGSRSELEEVSLDGEGYDGNTKRVLDSSMNMAAAGTATPVAGDSSVRFNAATGKEIVIEDSAEKQAEPEPLPLDEPPESDTSLVSPDLVPEIETVRSDDSSETETSLIQSWDTSTTGYCDGATKAPVKAKHPLAAIPEVSHHNDNQGDSQPTESSEAPKVTPDSGGGSEESQPVQDKTSGETFNYLDMNSSDEEDLRSSSESDKSESAGEAFNYLELNSSFEDDLRSLV